jgi:hypothetical protein
VLVVVDLDRRVDAQQHRHLLLAAVGALITSVTSCCGLMLAARPSMEMVSSP